MFYPFQSPEPEHRYRDAKSIFIILMAITIALSVNAYLYHTHTKPSFDKAKTITKTTDKFDWPKFTLEEVADHNTPENCWMSAYGNVYDVTEYVAEQNHPGGQNQLLSGCGQEVTDIFDRIHSNRATNDLEEFKIGILQNN